MNSKKNKKEEAKEACKRLLDEQEERWARGQ